MKNKIAVTQVSIMRNGWPSKNEQGHSLYTVWVKRGQRERKYIVNVYNAGIGMLDSMSHSIERMAARTQMQGEFPFVSYEVL